MIVCLCRGVNERTIQSAIQRGAETVDDLTAACGAGGGCGACRNAIACLIEKHSDSNVLLSSGASNLESASSGAASGASFAGSQGRP